MPRPIQEESIVTFRGIQEGVNALSVPSIFSSGDSKNVWMDELARVRKILGYAKQNSSAVTTDTGASATALVGLFGYRDASGGSVSRSLIGVFDDGTDEWEIHTSTDQGANWTFRADIGSGPVGKRPDFAQFGSETYIAIGGDGTPRVWDNSSISTAGGTQSPQPSASVGSAGNLNGDYEYKLVSIEADGSRHPGSLVSTNLILTDEAADLTWSADADGDVVGYELYRTTGTGLEFYYVTTIDGRTTTSHTDDLPDNELLGNRDLQEHGDAPPSVYLVEPHKQRMWFGRTDTDPRRAYYSDPNDPDSVWADNNYLDFDDDRSTGDIMRAMVGGYKGALVVFLERSIWTVSGTGIVQNNLQDWNVRRTASATGAVSPHSVARVPAGALFIDSSGQTQRTGTDTLAYFTPIGDIRIFDGQTDRVISDPVTDTLDDFNYGDRDQTFALHDPERFHITWFFSADSNSYPSDAVTWNYKFGIWYNSPTPSTFASGVCVESATEEAVCLLGEAQTSNGGFCYKLWSGNDFDGSDIEAVWFSKPFFGTTEDGGQVLAHQKRWRWSEFIVNTSEPIMVSWYDDFSSSNPDTTAHGTDTIDPAPGEPLATASGSVIQTTSGTPIHTANRTATARVYLLGTGGNYQKSRAMRIKVSDDSSNAPWTLDALTFAYQVLPGFKDLNS